MRSIDSWLVWNKAGEWHQQRHDRDGATLLHQQRHYARTNFDCVLCLKFRINWAPAGPVVTEVDESSSTTTGFCREDLLSRFWVRLQCFTLRFAPRQISIISMERSDTLTSRNLMYGQNLIIWNTKGQFSIKIHHNQASKNRLIRGLK